MDKELERLVSTKSLKATKLAKFSHHNIPPLFFDYNRESDSLMFLFVSPDTETVVHYIDEDVALLYEPETLEVVGIQVEDFVRNFIPKHDKVQNAWRLSKATADLSEALKNDLGDLVLAVELKKRDVAREVFKASESVVHRQGLELFGVMR